MATMPNEADYKNTLVAAQAGKAVEKYFLQQTIPENTSVLVVGLVVVEGTEDAVLAAINAIGNVSVTREIARLRTPSWTPPGSEWEIRTTVIGGHQMIPPTE